MKILEQLISIPSVSGDEKTILKFVCDQLKSLELEPFYIGNSIAVQIKGKNRSNALVFNAHVDTVSPGDPAKWKSNPFSPKLIGDKIYGLGASDEKAAVALLIKLAQSYKDIIPACDVWLTFVSKEEIDGSGTKDVLKWFSDNYKNKYKKVAGVLGEPTDLKTIEIAHKGNLFLKVTIDGDSGHGSRPWLIMKHSIFEMAKLFSKIEELNEEFRKKYSNKILGDPTISITSINGGDINSPNKFADKSMISLDVRTTPEIHDIAYKLVKDTLKNAEVVLISKPAPFGMTNESEEIVKLFKQNTNAKVGFSEGSNDMCFFTVHQMPAVVFGPGTQNCIHKPNEYCKLENIEKCVEIYKKIVNSFAEVDKGFLNNRN